MGYIQAVLVRTFVAAFALGGVLCHAENAALPARTPYAIVNRAANSRVWSRLTWGQETNGYSGGVGVTYVGNNNFQVAVSARRTISVTGIPEVKTNLFAGPPYLVATNWFCGPIELRDGQNKNVPVLKPEVLSSNAYPDTLSWRVVYFGDNQISGPVPGKSGLFDSRTRETQGSLGFFNLNDYFNLNEKGEYKLTVWPKIYKRSATNDDLYQRIDIPPVTVTVQY